MSTRSIYTIDFETYYDTLYSLKKMTTQEYILSPQFEIIGVAIQKDDEPAQWFSYNFMTEKGRDSYQQLLNTLHGEFVCAHNAPFDAAILSLRFGVIPSVILDTMAMARPHHGLTVGGSLAALAQHYDLGEKGEEVIDAKGKCRAHMITDGSLESYGRYCINDVHLTRKLFHVLAKLTSTMELRVIDLTVRMSTEPKLLLDADMLRAALELEVERKTSMLQELGIELGTLMSNVKFADELRAHGVEPPTKTSPTTGRETYAFAKSDKKFTALMEHDNPTVRKLVDARIANKSTINESRMRKLINLSHLGPLCVPLMYCGAVTTWRWTGHEGLNMQNLPSRGDKLIRKAIMAPPGHKLVVADSSNIELRTNHTLSGQLDTIQKLRDGVDLYVEFACILYNIQRHQVTPQQRFVGKVAHLSLGYGCGAVKFREMCRIAGIDLTAAEAQNTVDTWRNAYRQVVGAWRHSDRLIRAIANKAEYALPTAPFIKAGEGMLQTPPQHFIKYPELKRDDDGWSYLSRTGRVRKRVNLYGGKVMENVCQHVSRNILAEQFATIVKKYPASLMVHDELICVVPEGEAEEALAFMLKVMSTPPVWWPEVPLAAEGDIVDRYGDEAH